MKRLLMLACAVLVLAGNGFAQEEHTQKYDWGFGWDSGLTLRRNFDQWQVGVSAGPDDYLRDNFRHDFSSDLPDSMQGRLQYSDHNRRESGFVRLHVAREVLRRDNLLFQGLLSGIYSWTDFMDEDLSYYFDEDEGVENLRRSTTERFTHYYHLLVGMRVSWFPVSFLSLEHEFGLTYRWIEGEEERRIYDERDHSLDHDVYETREQSFQSFGPYSLTGDIQIVFWF